MDERCRDVGGSASECRKQPACKYVAGKCVPKTPEEWQKEWNCPRQSEWLREQVAKEERAKELRDVADESGLPEPWNGDLAGRLRKSRFQRNKVKFEEDTSLRDSSSRPEANFLDDREIKLSVDGVTFVRPYSSGKLQIYSSGLERVPYQPYRVTGIGDQFHDPARSSSLLESKQTDEADAAAAGSGTSGASASASEQGGVASGAQTQTGADQERLSPADVVNSSVKVKHLDYVTLYTQAEGIPNILRLNYAMLNGRNPRLRRRFFWSNICLGQVSTPPDAGHVMDRSGGHTRTDVLRNLERQIGSSHDAKHIGPPPENLGAAWNSEEADAGAHDLFISDEELLKQEPDRLQKMQEEQKRLDAGITPLPEVATESYTNYYSPIRAVDKSKEKVPWNCGELLPLVLLEDDIVRKTVYRGGLPSFPEIAQYTTYETPPHDEAAKKEFFERFDREVWLQGPSIKPQLAATRRMRMLLASGILSRDALLQFLPILVFAVEIFILFTLVTMFIISFTVYYLGDTLHRTQYLYHPTRAEYDVLVGRHLPPGTSEDEKRRVLKAVPRRGTSPLLITYAYNEKRVTKRYLFAIALTTVIQVVFLYRCTVRRQLLYPRQTNAYPWYETSVIWLRLFACSYVYMKWSSGFGILKTLFSKNRHSLFHGYYLCFATFMFFGVLCYLSEFRGGTANRDWFRWTSIPIAFAYMFKYWFFSISVEAKVIQFLFLYGGAPSVSGAFVGLLKNGFLEETHHVTVEAEAQQFFEHKALVLACARKWRVRARQRARDRLLRDHERQRRLREAEHAQEMDERDIAERFGVAEKVRVEIRPDARDARTREYVFVEQDYAFGGDNFIRARPCPGKLFLLAHLLAVGLAFIVSMPKWSTTVVTKGPLPTVRYDTCADPSYPLLTNNKRYALTTIDPPMPAPSDREKEAQRSSDLAEEERNQNKDDFDRQAEAAIAERNQLAKQRRKAQERMESASGLQSPAHYGAGATLEQLQQEDEALKQEGAPSTVSAASASATTSVTTSTTTTATRKVWPDTLEGKLLINDKRLLESREKPTRRLPIILSESESEWVLDPDNNFFKDVSFRSFYMHGYRPMLFYYFLLPLNVVFLVEIAWCIYIDRMTGRSLGFFRWLNILLVSVFFLHISCHLFVHNTEDNMHTRPPALFEGNVRKGGNNPFAWALFWGWAPCISCGSWSFMMPAVDTRLADHTEAEPLAGREVRTTYAKLDSVAKEQFNLHPERPFRILHRLLEDPFDPSLAQTKRLRDQWTWFQGFCLDLQEFCICLQAFNALFIIQHVLSRKVQRVFGVVYLYLGSHLWEILLADLLFAITLGWLYFVSELYRVPEFKYAAIVPDAHMAQQRLAQQIVFSQSVNSKYSESPMGYKIKGFGDGVWFAGNLLITSWLFGDNSDWGEVASFSILYFAGAIGCLPIAIIMGAIHAAINEENSFLDPSLQEAAENDHHNVMKTQAKVRHIVKEAKSRAEAGGGAGAVVRVPGGLRPAAMQRPPK
eukprot:g12667.t1